MTRDELINEFVTLMVDGTDTDTLAAYAHNCLVISMETLTDEELRAEIADFYPDLLEEEGIDNVIVGS